jgi:hypothetical protein
VQLEIQSLSKPICAQLLLSITHVHITHVLCALDHIRIDSVSCGRAFAIDNRKRHEISDTEAQHKKEHANHRRPHNSNYCKCVQHSSETEPQTDPNFKRDGKLLSNSAEIFQRSISRAQHLRPYRALPQPPGMSRETAHFPLRHSDGMRLVRLTAPSFACISGLCGTRADGVRTAQWSDFERL